MQKGNTSSTKSVNKKEEFDYSNDSSIESFDESVCQDSISSDLTASTASSTHKDDSVCSSDSDDDVSANQDPELSKASVKKLLQKKMTNVNSAKPGTYKKASYACNKRDQVGTQNLDDFFELGNPFNENNNNDFYGKDEGSNLAAYAGCGNKKLSEEDAKRLIELQKKRLLDKRKFFPCFFS